MFILICCVATANPGRSAESPVRDESPKLRRLMEELRAGTQNVVTNFWAEMNGKAPLVEAIPGDREFRWITFLWRGDETTREIVIYGEPPSRTKKSVTRLEGTDVWFVTDRIPKDSRFGYAFQINGGPIQLDPLNPRSLAGRSVVELPDAPPEPWILSQSNAPKGVRIQLTLKSEVLDEERALAVYTPPGYGPKNKPRRLLLVFDGESYGYSEHSAIQTPVILDNLLAAQRIPPTIAIFINSQKTRDRDLVCFPRFAQFLAEELVPWARSKYHVSKRPSDVILAGSSYGGLCAAFCAWRYPKVFGNALSQSGSFGYSPDPPKEVVAFSEETGWLIHKFVTTSELHARFCLQVGKFEAPMIPDQRRLRDVLEAKGCQVTYSEVSGGHDYITWRGSFAEGLMALIGIQTSSAIESSRHGDGN